MRLFVSGSAPLLAETHREWSARTGHAVLERYGMTETNMNTSNPYDGERVPGAVGFPLPGVSLRVVDPETGKSWYDLTSQAFAVFLPVKSVGVMGDGRTYEYVVALRAVQTLDFMTAHWAHLPHELLGHVSNRIINEVRGINRVVYDISGKPPATIEWE